MTNIINPRSLTDPQGYNHGIRMTGDLLLISGQIGWDRNRNFAQGLTNQFELALKNILAVVEGAGGKPDHIARLTIFIKNKKEYIEQRNEIGTRYRALMGKHFPAMSLFVVSDLLEDQALVEIEATVVLPS